MEHLEPREATLEDLSGLMKGIKALQDKKKAMAFGYYATDESHEQMMKRLEDEEAEFERTAAVFGVAVTQKLLGTSGEAKMWAPEYIIEVRDAGKFCNAVRAIAAEGDSAKEPLQSLFGRFALTFVRLGGLLFPDYEPDYCPSKPEVRNEDKEAFLNLKDIAGNIDYEGYLTTIAGILEELPDQAAAEVLAYYGYIRQDLERFFSGMAAYPFCRYGMNSESGSARCVRIARAVLKVLLEYSHSPAVAALYVETVRKYINGLQGATKTAKEHKPSEYEKDYPQRYKELMDFAESEIKALTSSDA